MRTLIEEGFKTSKRVTLQSINYSVTVETDDDNVNTNQLASLALKTLKRLSKVENI